MVRINDRRNVAAVPVPEEPSDEAAPSIAPDGHTSGEPHSGDVGDAGPAEAAAARVEDPSQEAVQASSEEPVVPDYRDLYLRTVAELDNFRKRTVREQTGLIERASERLVERLLPVLDNLENAIAHGEGGPGVEMTYKGLVKTLADEGLVEVGGEGAEFDPRVHDAFEAEEDAEVGSPTVRRVLRKGYRFRDKVVRPAMVRVARPPEGRDRESSGEAAGDEGPDPETEA